MDQGLSSSLTITADSSKDRRPSVQIDHLTIISDGKVFVMRRTVFVMFCTLGLVGALFGSVSAGETGHYVNGVEGIKAATLPPAGSFCYRLYNVFYNSDTLKDPDGDELDVGFDLSVYAMANRFIWITNKKILGADFGADIIIPLVYTDVEIGAIGVTDDKFGLGDVAVEPFVLSWHGPRHDAAFGIALYIPTGEYDENEPASPSKDFWTGMFTLGGTWYFDAAKTWSASILARYELHSEKDSKDVRPGDDFHFEWGIAKTLAKIWDVGLTGYCHWQVTDDTGSDVDWDKSDHDSVYAVGPEVVVFIPPATLFVSLRSQWEFEAVDRPEGNVTTLTLTKLL